MRVSTFGALAHAWNFQRVPYLPFTATNRTSSVIIDLNLMQTLRMHTRTQIGPPVSKHVVRSVEYAFDLLVERSHTGVGFNQRSPVHLLKWNLWQPMTRERMSDCCLQGIQPCECKGEGHRWIGTPLRDIHEWILSHSLMTQYFVIWGSLRENSCFACCNTSLL